MPLTKTEVIYGFIRGTTNRYLYGFIIDFESSKFLNRLTLSKRIEFSTVRFTRNTKNFISKIVIAIIQIITKS